MRDYTGLYDDSTRNEILCALLVGGNGINGRAGRVECLCRSLPTGVSGKAELGAKKQAGNLSIILPYPSKWAL